MALDLFKKREKNRPLGGIHPEGTRGAQGRQDSQGKKQEKEADVLKQAIEAKEKKEAKASLSAKAPVVLGGNIMRSQVTEKASRLHTLGQYAFLVKDNATKGSVGDAIEKAYKVNVVSVNMIQKHDKTIRSGRRQGIRPGYKKAIVTLQKGQTIESSK